MKLLHNIDSSQSQSSTTRVTRSWNNGLVFGIDEPTCCSEFYPPRKAPPTLWHPSSIASFTHKTRQKVTGFHEQQYYSYTNTCSETAVLEW